MDHPKSNLKIVEASEYLEQLDGVSVTTAGGEELGHVEGFVVDTNSGQPSHVVVDAGGWFTSKYFLLPIRSAQMTQANDTVVADVTRDEVKKFPGFDKGEFEEITEDEIAGMTRLTPDPR
jgi:sporulation protein YlmC with PRC-barrel domain